MKKLILFVISFYLVQYCFGQETIDVKFEYLKSFKFGKGDNEIGISGGPMGLLTTGSFISGKNGFLYLNDWANFRYIKYDYNLNIIDFIKYEPAMNFPNIQFFNVDNAGNIIGISSKDNLCKINLKGKLIYTIDSSLLPEMGIDFWLYKDKTFIYTKTNRTDNKKPAIVSEQGIILAESKVIEILLDLFDETTTIFPQELKERIRNYIIEQKLFFIENKIIGPSANQINEYIKILRNYSHENTSEINDMIFQHIFDIDNKNYYITGNLNGSSCLFVFTLAGKLVAVLRGNDEMFWNLVIGQNGDLFKLKDNRQKKQYEFYRMKNTWDPEGRARWESRH